LSALHPASNLKDQFIVFISPIYRVAQLYPQEPGSLFVAFYDSQGYSEGILTCLHRGLIFITLLISITTIVFTIMNTIDSVLDLL
jgi:hypothetical protein